MKEGDHVFISPDNEGMAPRGRRGLILRIHSGQQQLADVQVWGIDRPWTYQLKFLSYWVTHNLDKLTAARRHR